MTSTRALQFALEILENDKSKAAPLIKLLAAFRAARGDPLGEAMMSTVLKTLYIETEHCEAALAEFVGQEAEIVGDESNRSIAA